MGAHGAGRHPADELFLGHNSVIVGVMITSVLNIADASAA
jgi:hypothetical protein